jgi:hypothetical protein
MRPMISRLPLAVSISVLASLAAACGAGPSSVPPSEPSKSAPLVDVTPPPPAAPAPADSSTTTKAKAKADDAPPPPKSGLAPGSPFFGAYEVTSTVLDGKPGAKMGLRGCTLSECVFRRKSFSFEGNTLRVRYVVASLVEHEGDRSVTMVCDARGKVEVRWEGDAVVVPTTFTTEASVDTIRRQQRRAAPGKFNVDWDEDNTTCSTTLDAGRYVVKEVSAAKTAGRPDRMVLEAPGTKYVLEASDDQVDMRAAINDFFGQK